MKHIHRRDVLRGGGLAALAACSPKHGDGAAKAQDQVLVFADKLLSESAGLSCGEWIERKRIARAVQALVTDQVTPWTEDHEVRTAGVIGHQTPLDRGRPNAGGGWRAGGTPSVAVDVRKVLSQVSSACRPARNAIECVLRSAVGWQCWSARLINASTGLKPRRGGYRLVVSRASCCQGEANHNSRRAVTTSLTQPNPPVVPVALSAACVAKPRPVAGASQCWLLNFRRALGRGDGFPDHHQFSFASAGRSPGIHRPGLLLETSALRPCGRRANSHPAQTDTPSKSSFLLLRGGRRRIVQ